MLSEWVEFNAPLDTIQVISEAEGFMLSSVTNSPYVWRTVVYNLKT